MFPIGVVEGLPKNIPNLSLSHGQARWVFQHLGLHSGGRDPTDSYLIYLRRNGVPFSPQEIGKGRGQNVVYGYYHLMEIALALYLRTQGILKGHVVGLLAEDRKKLRRLYRRAYLERQSGLGSPTEGYFSGPGIEKDNNTRTFSGTYLNMTLNYTAEGVFIAAINPTLISAYEAISKYGAHYQNFFPRLPVPLSQLAENIVLLAPEAPELKRGRTG